MRKQFRYFLFPFLLLPFICSMGQDEPSQWTRFRGPNGQGIDTVNNAPVTWDSSDYLWKITLPGIGHSSPVVWDHKIFVTSAGHKNHKGYVVAVDQNDGSKLWQNEYHVSDLTMHKDNNLASPTPAVDESHLFFIWYSNEKTILTALAHDGTFRWQAEFEGINARHGGGSSLMLTQTNVVFTRELETDRLISSSWVAVNKQTGETAWELKRETAGGNSFSTPILVTSKAQPDQLIFTSHAHGFTSVDPATGEVLWERKDLLTHRVVASPIFSEGIVIGCRKGEGVALAFDPHKNIVSDTVLYRLPRNIAPYVPTPIIVGELLFLFLDNGSVACVRLSTGELLWKERPAGPIYGSPVCVDGKLYCITKAGKVIVLGASTTYEILGIHPLGESSFSTPVMCNSGIIFRTLSNLLLVGNGQTE